MLAMAWTIAVALPPERAAGQPVSARDCLDISVDTANQSQLESVIRICTLALQGKDLAPRTRAEILGHRGIAFRNTNALEQSVADLSTAAKLAPDDTVVSRMLGWTLREMGRLVEAEQEFDRALRLEPHAQGFLSRCFVRFDLQKFQEALADCEAAHQIDPSEDSTYLTARLYRSVGRPEAALPMLEAIVGTPMESGRIHGLLADLYEALGRRADAQRVRQQGRRKFPRDPSPRFPPR